LLRGELEPEGANVLGGNEDSARRQRGIDCLEALVDITDVVQDTFRNNKIKLVGN
jgi:hypothetical protein